MQELWKCLKEKAESNKKAQEDLANHIQYAQSCFSVKRSDGIQKKSLPELLSFGRTFLNAQVIE